MACARRRGMGGGVGGTEATGKEVEARDEEVGMWRKRDAIVVEVGKRCLGDGGRMGEVLGEVWDVVVRKCVDGERWTSHNPAIHRLHTRSPPSEDRMRIHIRMLGKHVEMCRLGRAHCAGQETV